MWNHLVAVETAVMKENRFKGVNIKGTWNVQCPLCRYYIVSAHGHGPEDIARAHANGCSLFQREYNNMLYRMRHLCASVSVVVVRSPWAHR
jgi:hypothetical protein